MALPLPEFKESFSPAVEEAMSKLGGMDRHEVAARSGSRLEGESIVTEVMGREIVIDLDERRIFWSDGSYPPPDIKVLTLHYLLGVRGPPLPGWKSFREFESGSLYYPVFHSRALARLVSRFGSDPISLKKAAARLGGVPVERGDASFDFMFFPNMLVNVTVWAGDEEVPPSANILFDPSAGEYLGAEDLAHIAENIVDMLFEACQ